MKTLALIMSAFIANGLLASSVLGQTDKELDITMSIVDETESPAAIINRIELPPASAFVPPPAVNEPVVDAAVVDATVVDGSALDQIQDDLQNTTGDLLNTTGDVLTNTINDALSGGDPTQLPGEIIDNLPDGLPDDLLPVPLPDGLLQAPADVVEGIQETGPAVESTLDSVIDDLEQQSLPDNIEQDLDSALPLDNVPVEPLPLPDKVLDEPSLPVNP